MIVSHCDRAREQSTNLLKVSGRPGASTFLLHRRKHPMKCRTPRAAKGHLKLVMTRHLPHRKHVRHSNPSRRRCMEWRGGNLHFHILQNFVTFSEQGQGGNMSGETLSLFLSFSLHISKFSPREQPSKGSTGDYRAPRVAETIRYKPRLRQGRKLNHLLRLQKITFKVGFRERWEKNNVL